MILIILLIYLFVCNYILHRMCWCVHSPRVCERGGRLGDDQPSQGGGQNMLCVVAAARAHHAAVALWMLQRKHVGMVQLRLWVCVLGHTGLPVMGENLGVRGVRRWDLLQGTCTLSPKLPDVFEHFNNGKVPFLRIH